MPRKIPIAAIALIGLLLPIGFNLSLWQNETSLPLNSVLIDVFVVNKFSILFNFVFIFALAIVILISNGYRELSKQSNAEYYALLFFSTCGMMLLVSARELIIIYISLELTTLPIAALAAFGKNQRSVESAMKLLILNGISSALLLYGMVLLYGLTGTTVLKEIGEIIARLPLNQNEPFGNYALLLSIVLMSVGFGFKITAVPFHMWAPDVYEGAPTPITAFLSVASKAAGFGIILQVLHIALKHDMIFADWSKIFSILALSSMLLGNFVAISQSNIKRMLAYSSIAHAGYMLVGISALTTGVGEFQNSTGPSNILFYLCGYAITNLAAFSVIIVVSNRESSDQISDFSGLGKKSPYMAAVLSIAMVSLTGLPPGIGFITKLYIFGSAIQNGVAWLAIVGVLTSVVSAYYYLRIIKVMYMSDPSPKSTITASLPVRLAVIGTGVCILVFGIYPKPLLELSIAAGSVFQ